MQSCLQNISVAFTTCVEQQIRPRYIILDAVGGRLHNTACMARCGLRDAFVWLSKPQTIEDHVLYHATVEVGEQGNVPTRRSIPSLCVVGEGVPWTDGRISLNLPSNT